MKVALFSDTFSPQINGVTNTMDKLTGYFESSGIEYKIFAPRYDRDEDFQAERFYSLKFFLYPECRIALPNIFRVSQVLSDFKPDIIHLMTEFNMGITGLYYGKKNNIPTISNYSTNFSQYTDYYGLDFLKQTIWDYMKWFHNQNDLTLCPSNEAKRTLEQHGISNTAIFSRGIDFHSFSRAYRNDALRRRLDIENKLTFLYVGRVSFEKDLDVLRESYRVIKEEYGDRVALIITGDGPYLGKCREMFPGDTVFTGFKRGMELSELYASCDIFVCPSSTETFGNVVLEAMASGLAVIGADAGGVGEIIGHRYNGLLFRAKDAGDLYVCMKELIENKLLAEHVKANGVNYGKDRSWERIIGGLVDIYRAVSGERGTISA